MSMDDQGRLSEPASPMDLDDHLSEILLRLPQLPCSLSRASLVCNRWRRLVTDPSFVRRFRAHHSRPLGVFFSSDDHEKGLHSFRSISDPRYPAPSQRFTVRVRRECQGAGGTDDDSSRRGYAWVPHGCRHGRVVLSHSSRYGYGTRGFLVWNPVTGEHHVLDIARFSDPDRNQNGAFMQGAVVSAAGDEGPFKFALAWDEINYRTAHICVYSSETGAWGDVVSVAFDSLSTVGQGNVVVGNTLYWIVFGSQVHILQFDLGSKNLAVIEVPRNGYGAYGQHCGIYLCTLAEGGGPSLIVMAADLRAQLWVWEMSAADSDGGDGARWMRGRTIELGKLLGLRPGGFWKGAWKVLRLEGDDNLIFVSTCSGVFMVHLESMQFEKVFETSPISLSDCRTVYPLKNPYASGTGLANCSLVSMSTDDYGI